MHVAWNLYLYIVRKSIIKILNTGYLIFYRKKSNKLKRQKNFPLYHTLIFTQISFMITKYDINQKNKPSNV